MIVNPQLLKNKIVSSFAITSVVLIFTYGLFSYAVLKTEQNQLQQENKVLENELSIMIDKFDDAKEENQDLHQDIQVVKDNAAVTSSIVESLKTELSIVPKIKKKVSTIQNKNISLEEENEVLKNETQVLKQETIEVKEALENQQYKNETLQKEADRLKKVTPKTIIVKEASFRANAMSASFLGKKKMTTRAAKAKTIEVDFTIDANSSIEPGKKAFYIQVIGPDNNIVADKGVVKFGDSQLIFSHKKTIDYTNTVLDVKAKIKNKASFKKGTYFISIFHKNVKVGSTKIVLN